MTIQFRRYTASDYERVGQLLISSYQAQGPHANWLQPRWEYMHYHPNIRGMQLGLIGVWESQGRIVGVVHPEHEMGTVYYQVAPSFEHLRQQMLLYAQEHLSTATDEGRSLTIFIDDADLEFQALATALGYKKQTFVEAMSHLPVAQALSPIRLPDGFRIKSLQEDNDMHKVRRLYWRGFNHGEEPPDRNVEDIRLMQSAPSFDRALNVVVEDAENKFVSYCGMWYEPTNQIAYVEPVCTDPAFRRLGLARAAIMEGIRRCAQKGAKVACVGATLSVYASLGFRRVYNSSGWRRIWA